MVQSDKDGYRSFLKSEDTLCLEIGQYYHFFVSIPPLDMACNTSHLVYENFLSLKCSGPSKNCSSNFDEMDQEFEGGHLKSHLDKRTLAECTNSVNDMDLLRSCLRSFFGQVD